jgi:hypothetical protein
MPTGAPFRNIYIKLTAYDDTGEPIWQNAEGHPAKDDPQAYMAYALKDDDGMPAPPPTATKPGDDTRLKPHEERTLEYDIPAEGVALVRGPSSTTTCSGLETWCLRSSQPRLPEKRPSTNTHNEPISCSPSAPRRGTLTLCN